MAEWATVELRDLIDPSRGISYGIVQPGAPVFDGVPIIRVSDVRDGHIRISSPLRIAKNIESSYSRTRLRGGELLLTIVGTVGETAIVPDALCGWNVARAIAVLPVIDSVGAYWVQLSLRSPHVRAAIDSRLNTTVQATLNLGDIAKLPILLPPLNERRSIGDILQALDDKIDLNRRMNETLEAMARAIFKDWFVDFGPTKAKMEGRSPYLAADIWSLFPDRLDDDGKPEGWGPVELGNLADIQRGLSYKGSGLVTSDFGKPLHNLNSVLEGGGYKYAGIKFYSGDFKDYHTVSPDDVIVANTEQGHDRLLIGYAALVPRRFGVSGLFSHHLYRVRARRESGLTSSFICNLLNSESVHDAISSSANGSTVNMLPIDSLKRFMFSCPPTKIIEKFDDAIRPGKNSIETNIESGNMLASMRDLLLPKLMSGEIRIKDAEKVLEDVL